MQSWLWTRFLVQDSDSTWWYTSTNRVHSSDARSTQILILQYQYSYVKILQYSQNSWIQNPTRFSRLNNQSVNSENRLIMCSSPKISLHFYFPFLNRVQSTLSEYSCSQACYCPVVQDETMCSFNSFEYWLSPKVIRCMSGFAAALFFLSPWIEYVWAVKC